MATFPIKNLGELGVIADLAPTDLPPNAFTDAINARFVAGRVFKMGGNFPVSFYDGKLPALSDKRLTPLSFQYMPFDFYSGDNSFMIVGDKNRLYRLDSYDMQDISRRAETKTKTAYAKISVRARVNDFAFDKSYVALNKKVGTTVSTTTVHITPASILPTEVQTQDKRFIWTSGNPALVTVAPSSDTLSATISAVGTITGSVPITVTNVDKTVTRQIVVDVVDNVTGIVLNSPSYTMNNGDVYTLSVIFLPAGAATRNVTWSVTSGDATAVTLTPVGSQGLSCRVKANHVSPSPIVITAMTAAPVHTATSSITIASTTRQVTLNYNALTLYKGKSTTLTANTFPQNAQVTGVDWYLSAADAAVLSIAPNGNTVTVTSKGVTGQGDVVARSREDNRITATCRFTVPDIDPADIIHDESDDGNAGGPVNLSMVDTSEGMKDGVPFYDFTYVNGDDYYNQFADMPAQAPPPPTLDVKLSITSKDLQIGESVTITAIPTPSNLFTNDLVAFHWSVDQSDHLTVDTISGDTITITAAKGTTTNNPVTLTCTMSYLEQTTYTASPDHTWYHAVISNSCVATTYYETPQVKAHKDKFFRDLPGWGEQTVVDGNGVPSIVKYNWKCERVRAFNNRLFALNMRETNASGATTHYPLRLRWSNFANENEPPLLWDDFAYNRLTESDQMTGSIGQVEALENGYAGYIDLADSIGDLIDMLPLKDYLFVYTEFETYLGTPTMNAYQPFMFKKLFNESGILAPECVCEVEGQHFVVTQNDIILHNGATKKSIASNRVKDKIIKEIGSVNPLATKVHLHSDKKEVWITYVNAGSPKGSWACNKAAIWNYEYDTWTFCEIPHSYDIGLTDPPIVEKGATWSDLQTTTWDQSLVQKMVWQKDITNFHRRITMVASAMGGFHQVDIGPYGSVPIDIGDLSKGYTTDMFIMKVERIGIDFDNVTNEWNQKHINVIRPQVTGKGLITFEAGGSQYSNDYGHKHSTKDYLIGSDRLVCVRLNHPYLYYTIIDRGTYGTDSKTNLPLFNDCAINGLTIEYAVGGRR